ncbi:THAP domain-containing protein 5-like isoform X4 [Branchiostoma floridae]|uniref:THAP domain-containing protein 5-like isoform X4 n=1 Tax=Branchiostoma floridae TaxID=7739 RepID=A0A9J7N9K9_BRAFL|nr:THAP domain-containing protein 5-like isoform X4 [Branchiostoma floridae]
MPTSCCALNCTNRKDKGSRKKFFRIPAEPGRRAAWLRALKRSDFEQGKKNPTAAWTPRGHERVCSDHFISGNPSKDPADPDYVPSLFNLPTSASCNRSRNPVAKKDRYMRAAKRLRVSSENEAPPTSLNDEEMIADPPPESVETLRDPLPESVETLREQLTKVQEEKCKLEQFCESLQSEADNLREERDHLQEQVTSTPESPHCNLWVSISGIRLDFTNWTHVDNITFNSDWSLGTFTTTMPALVHTTKSHVETPVTSICVWTWV